MIHHLITALQRQLQRSDITLICEIKSIDVSFNSSQSVTVSQIKIIKMFLRRLRGGPRDFLEGRDG